MAKSKKGKPDRRFKPYNKASLPPRPPPSPLIPASPMLRGPSPFRSSTCDMTKVYVLIATHHAPMDPDGILECTCTTTVCGVFTSLVLARLAKADQCRRWGFHTRDNHVHCRRDGSYCTTFQIAEREIWAFPYAPQPILFNRAAEQQQRKGGWMMGNNDSHQAPGATTARTISVNAVTHFLVPKSAVVTQMVPNNFAAKPEPKSASTQTASDAVTKVVPIDTHGNNVGINDSKGEERREEEEKKMED